MKGTCDTGDNPAAVLDIWGWSELENNCLLEESGCDLVTSDYFDYDDTCFNITHSPDNGFVSFSVPSLGE